MPDDPNLTPADAPTRSIGPTVSDVSGVDPGAAPLLTAGQLFGPYVIVRLLGRGGMGEVYEAEDRDNARRVALKVLSQGLAAPVDRARFIREGRLAAGISHPNTVYVYGTDDIEGVPVIAMELAPGGTLKDLVKGKGQLPPAKAVDAILQVISGLEAAADAGVLHRDVKPSNCFVDSDGTVKVGDFGLSISTQTFDERSLTMLGTVLGTPGFSSPEQLRGDELDVRSDIYSVGATLYYLLTGRPPFDDPNVIRLVTQVAQQMPPSPRVARPDVPAELANVVMRCLAKRPADRFESYEALRAALEPFSSSAPSPAHLGVRFAAGLVDNIALMLLTLPVMSIWFDSMNPTGRTEGLATGSVASWIVVILYFGLMEGAWGRSLGKQMFGLRVVDAGNQRPGIPVGLLRATIWAVAEGAPMLAYSSVMLPVIARHQNDPIAALLGFSFGVLNLAIVAALFGTARRANGFAAVHDLLSGTRVVLKRRERDRRRAGTVVPTPLPAARGERLGPYVLLDERPIGVPEVITGYDDRLRRKVWIRRGQAGEPALPPERRLLTRPTRLRWVSGQRTATEAWDAYEAPGGGLLVKRESAPARWEEVRLWLADLATDLRAALAEGALPPLSMDRVWITSAGRARLLDWGVAVDSPPMVQGTSDVQIGRAQRFLFDVARAGLRAGSDTSDAGLSVPLPVRARAFLTRLERGGFENLDAVAREAAILTQEPAAVRRSRRTGHVLLAALPTATFTALMLVTTMVIIRAQTLDSARADLAEALTRLDRLEREPQRARDPGEARALEMYIASRHAAAVADPATWSEGWSMLRFNRRLEPIARRAVAAHPNLSPEDRAAVTKIVEPFLEEERTKARRMISARGVLAVTLFTASLATLAVAALGLISGLLFRGGLMLMLFGIAVATPRGEAGRLRAFGRALIAWSPAALALLAVLRESGPTRIGWMLFAAASFTVFAIGVVFAIRNPERSLQDRLAGTWLVPR